MTQSLTGQGTILIGFYTVPARKYIFGESPSRFLRVELANNLASKEYAPGPEVIEATGALKNYHARIRKLKVTVTN